MANLGEQINPHEWQIVGRVQGLGTKRGSFEQWLNQEAQFLDQQDRPNWSYGHVVGLPDGIMPEVVAGRLWLNPETFFELYYVDAVKNWMLSQFPWMTQALLLTANDIYEWLPGDATAYMETGAVLHSLPGQAVAVLNTIYESMGRPLMGDQAVCINNQDATGRQGDRVPATYGEASPVPEPFAGLLYHTLLSPVLIPIAQPDVTIPEELANYPVLNLDFQQYSPEYYHHWRQEIRQVIAAAGLETLINPDVLTIEQLYHGTRVVVVKME